ncbi:hypothetical protein LINPERPRIM_LOCUS33036, partial [Linum perenne]
RLLILKILTFSIYPSNYLLINIKEIFSPNILYIVVQIEGDKNILVNPIKVMITCTY